MAKVSHTVRQYLAEIEAQNPVPDGDGGDGDERDDENDDPPRRQKGKPRDQVSKSDPDAAWASKGGPAKFAYYDNYLIDNAHGVIVGVQATPARFSEEGVLALCPARLPRLRALLRTDHLGRRDLPATEVRQDLHGLGRSDPGVHSQALEAVAAGTALLPPHRVTPRVQRVVFHRRGIHAHRTH